MEQNKAKGLQVPRAMGFSDTFSEDDEKPGLARVPRCTAASSRKDYKLVPLQGRRTGLAFPCSLYILACVCPFVILRTEGCALIFPKLPHLVSSQQVPALNVKDWAWRDGSEVVSAHHSCRRLEWFPEPTSGTLSCCNSTSRGADILFWTPRATVLMRTCEHVWAHLCVHTHKYNLK